jgi:16S rRNA A1518/A1519 N6-dimethyltransferase RsmA/KsgA/DIM1 with predicted DNA glycosylase/AP lyase activity
MFDIEFYPTPENVIEMMTTGLDLQGKTVLEPSAGSGNIVSYLKKQGANVLACERHRDLQRIVTNKCRLLKPDFFDVKAEEISHVDFIIMNPPFSNADKHIKHAFDIAPAGCQIVALCNANTLNNRYSRL